MDTRNGYKIFFTDQNHVESLPTATPEVKPRRQETFIARALRLFRQRVSSGAGRANGWQRRSAERIHEALTAMLHGRGRRRVWFWGLAVILWVASVVGSNWEIFGEKFVAELSLRFLLVSLLLMSLALVATLLFVVVFLLIRRPILAIPMVIWLLGYAVVQSVVLIARMFLLVPLALLFAGTRLIQLWQRRFYTCPSRQCAYRGLPIYVCPHCQESNRYLWPNLYGLFQHYCVGCEAKLPALDSLGRGKLQRRCGGCEMPLHGRHAGRAPERLVAVVGAPSSGKTNFLLMAVNEIINNHQLLVPLRGEIDDPMQAEEFMREWRKLTHGIPADKTSEVLKALLLYVKAGRAGAQLYLYDAPGEEFTSISAMTRQQYFHLLEGIVLLVDPLSFESLRRESGGADEERTSLQDVVTSMLGWTSRDAEKSHSGKIALRVAVVVSKADMACVRSALGVEEPARARSADCRAALIKWGGGNAIHALEHRFESVSYFACSPLGRAVDARDHQPFHGHGVVEPLAWVLNIATT